MVQSNKIRILAFILFFFTFVFLIFNLWKEYNESEINSFLFRISILFVFLILFLLFEINKGLQIFILTTPLLVFLSPDRFIFCSFFESVLLIFSVYLIKSRNYYLKINKFDISFLLFFVVALCSSLVILFKLGDLTFLNSITNLISVWQGEPYYPLRRVFVIYEGLILYLIIRLNSKNINYKLLRNNIIFAGLIFAVFAIITYFTRDLTAFYHGTNRTSSLFSNANVYATFALLVMPLIVGWLYEGKKYLKLKTLAGLTCLIALYLTFSKGAWIGFFACFILFLFYHYRNFFNSYGKILLISIAFILLIVFIYMIIFFTSHTDVEIQRASHGRYYIWSAGLNMLVNNPVLGIGAGAFYTELNNYYPSRINPWTEHEHAHNLFIQNFAEFGLIGGVLISFPLLYVFFFLRNNDILFTSVNISIIGIIIHSLFDYTLLSPILNVYLFILLGIAYNRHSSI